MLNEIHITVERLEECVGMVVERDVLNSEYTYNRLIPYIPELRTI